MNDISKIKSQLDVANSAIKLLEPFLKRSETWRFGQRLVAGVALVTIAASLVFGISEPRYTAAAVFLVMGVSFLTRERTWLTARHVAIKDDVGNFRAILTVADGEPTLAFLDGSGATRLRCGLTATGTPSVSLHDTSMQPRVIVAADPTSSPSFAFTDEKGRLRLQLGLSPSDEEGVLGLISESGHPMLLASASKERAYISGRDAAGKLAWIIPEVPST
jgi:hypothetical protein